MSLKYLLAIINSKMGQHLLNRIRGINNKDINPDSLRLIPIPQADETTQEKIIYNVDSIMNNHVNYTEEVSSFTKWLKRTFDITLNFDYDKLEYEKFLKKNRKTE